jgi:hypothetical protein
MCVYVCVCVCVCVRERERERPQKKTHKTEASKKTLHVEQRRTLHCAGVENIPSFQISQDRWTSTLDIPTVYDVIMYTLYHLQTYMSINSNLHLKHDGEYPTETKLQGWVC